VAVTNHKPGTIKPILFFENQQGRILLPPDDENAHRFRKQMRRQGFELMFADTIQQAEKLQRRLQEQLKREQEIELMKDELTTLRGRQGVRDRLRARMNSASCPEFERDAIKFWLAMREQKHEIFKRRFTQEIGHLDALEFDNPIAHTHDLLSRT